MGRRTAWRLRSLFPPGGWRSSIAYAARTDEPSAVRFTTRFTAWRSDVRGRSAALASDRYHLRGHAGPVHVWLRGSARRRSTACACDSDPGRGSARHTSLHHRCGIDSRTGLAEGACPECLVVGSAHLLWYSAWPPGADDDAALLG